MVESARSVVALSARVGAVAFALLVLGFFVVRAQRDARPARADPGAASPEAAPQQVPLAPVTDAVPPAAADPALLFSSKSMVITNASDLASDAAEGVPASGLLPSSKSAPLPAELLRPQTEATEAAPAQKREPQ